ncbi:hypothetical protein Tco_0979733 [Tanacetum coccineum]
MLKEPAVGLGSSIAAFGYTSAKLTRAELNKRSGDADLSKGKSGAKSPPEFWRSFHVEDISGDEGPSSGGTKLSSTFITAEVTFTMPKQPM